MEVEHSFGVIPYRIQNDRYEFFLIQHIAGHFTFPKGHPMGNETPIETVFRELQEETGIVDILIDETKLFESEYDLTRDTLVIHKHVTYFVGKLEGSPALLLQASEVQNALWLPFDAAKTTITFDEDRQNLIDAMAYLESAGK